MASLERDANRVPVAGGVTDDGNLTPTALRVDPTTKRLKVAATTTISSATITDIEDGTGDSIMDATNDALQVNLVASSGTLTVDATGQGDVPITLGGESVAVTNAGLTELASAINASSQIDVNIAADGLAGLEVIQATATDLNVTEANSTAILADTANIDTNIGTIAGAVTGSEMQVDVVTMPSTTVTATDLDIRDLTSASDSVTTEHNITSMGHGVKTVTTAGTDEALAGSTACKKVTVQSQTDNTGWIAVGASGVDATEATGTGVLLGAGDAYEFEIDNLADVYVDSTVNGEGVRYTFFS